jgi:hypothetical protein
VHNFRRSAANQALARVAGKLIAAVAA